MTVAALLSGPGMFAARPGTAANRESPGAVPPGRWVSVRAPFGKSPARVRTYMATSELSTVARVQTMIDGLMSGPVAPFDSNHVRWYVEPPARESQVYALQRQVLSALDRVIENQFRFEFVSGWPVSVIIARTQSYIARTLADLGCSPDLTRTNGVVLMGAAVCNRHVIISNVTGFLFLLRADQQITPTLENRPEPPMATMPYRIVMRNNSGLAHEYAHIWRAAALGGLVRTDEPAWFSEGFAEFWSGVAAVLAYPTRENYRTHHVLRLRDFFYWSPACPSSLSRYRTGSPLSNGCEYYLGALAIEYLYARYSSLEITQEAFTRAARYGNFADGFKATFGISIGQFEKEADAYINAVRRAETHTRRVLASQ